MHCDMLKIQDGVAIVQCEKLNYQSSAIPEGTNRTSTFRLPSECKAFQCLNPDHFSAFLFHLGPAVV